MLPTQSWNSTRAGRPARSPTPIDPARRITLPPATTQRAAQRATNLFVRDGPGVRGARHPRAMSDARDEHEGVTTARKGTWPGGEARIEVPKTTTALRA